MYVITSTVDDKEFYWSGVEFATFAPVFKGTEKAIKFHCKKDAETVASHTMKSLCSIAVKELTD